jgi:predicted ATPase/DNA-binding CsgD family transcriptional regulator
VTAGNIGQVGDRRDGNAAPSPVGHLPPELTSFVGRRAELHSIATVLAGARLVTLTGPGGVGKTRLAARAAARLRTGDESRDGVWWVDLAPETDPAAVPERVAEAVETLLVSGVDEVPSLVRQLADRRLWIVLDNCEHLLPAVDEVVRALLRGCPRVRLLATSREPIGAPGEVVWRVPPLDSHDAAALFADRGGVGDDASGAVRRICVRLDRIPLALELAAAWTGTLSPEEIGAALDDRFAVLVTGPHSAPSRQRTLEASMAWSHDLLGDADRVLFRRLAAFQPGFTHGVAQDVCGFDGLDRVAVLTGLRRLIDKSLLVAEAGGGGTTRYRMLETVREYATARLAEAGEQEAMLDRHLDAYLAFAEDVAPLVETDKEVWRARVGAEYTNLRAAIEWGLSIPDSERGQRLAAALAWLWHIEGRRTEGLGLMRLAADRGAGEDSALQARVLTGLALVADTVRPTGYEFDAADAAREMAERHGDERTAAQARSLTAIRLLTTDTDRAFAEAVAIAEGAPEGFARDAAHVLAGLVHHLRDQHAAARARIGPAHDRLARRGDRGVASLGLSLTALSHAYGGDLAAARDLAERAVATAAPLGDYHRVGSARAVLAMVLGMRGEVDEAFAAVEPVVRLIDGDAGAPFVPGLAKAVGSLYARTGRLDIAARWYRREMAWLGEAASDDVLTPDTRVALAAALRGTDPATSQRLCDSALAVARAVPMPRVAADALTQKAYLTEESDPDRAAVTHHEALALREAHGLRLTCLDSLDALASLSLRRGNPEIAARLLGAADRGRADCGYPRSISDSDVRGKLDGGAVAEGRAMDLDEAVAYARRARGTRPRITSGWASLTTTEREVVQLAVKGLSNPEIAKRLFMSRSTVKTHLAHVYAKIDVANRTELAAAYARATSATP